MSIAITEDHRALAETAADLLKRRDTRAAARALLEAADEPMPDVWKDVIELGWLGLHVPEALGGSGYGLEELVVVVEETGRALVPGPFVPTVIASAALVAAADDATQQRFVPGLADGALTAGIGFGGSLTVTAGKASGPAGTVLGGGLASVLVAAAGDDLVVVEMAGDGVTVESPTQFDPTRRSARVTLDGAPATVVPGGAAALTDAVRLILAAEAVGIARETTEQGAEYAKVRIQFGRPIAMYQAVKHHCANMLVATELATAAVWDAARAFDTGGDQRAFTAAIAASQAGPAAVLAANLNIQVHGGIGFTWEHDAHIYLRRATVIEGLIDPDGAAADVTGLTRTGVVRAKTIDLPPEAEAMREEIRAFADSIKDLDRDAQKTQLIETGYVMPHWPTPWGREAGAVEQLVIEQEFEAAGVKRPGYGITGWVILTLIQYADDDQVQRWVKPALTQEVVWCQLFSEPDAGSDAAGIKTKATRVDGGWLINGQKVWTSGAHISGMGFATVRTDPEAPKHEGITTMVIDMHAEGVEVRPLRMTSGASEFNEVFFNDVFVPDDDVVGPINGGWTVARATLGNESVSIGGGEGGMGMPGSMMVPVLDQREEHLPGGESRVGHYIAMQQAMGLLNLRSANRAVTGAGPGPEGAITKLVMSELGHEAAAIMSSLSSEESAFMDGPGMVSGSIVLMHRAMSIAGGTSEIKRNQIGERILGLPRDPLIK
ncbi:MAG: acyl-CoA dehydrogenase [Actinobacteria bacterium]|nr:acyl-CoA dehydrogenase [Actinomycetota bacterium]